MIPDSLSNDVLLGLWHLAVALWPIWLIASTPAIITTIARFYRRRRLAKAGIHEIDRMDGVTFEYYLEVLFGKLGYQAERTRTTGDFGADLIVTKDKTRTIIQAKRYSKNVGVKAVQEVVAAQRMYQGSRTMVVTNQSYTKQAQQLAQANNVELWDRDRLVSAILTVQKEDAKDKKQAQRREQIAPSK